MFSELLLREIPEHLLSGVGSGRYKVYGSIIRSIADGRIVGHLQETSGLSSVAMSLGTMSLQSGMIGSVAQVATIVQNEQIKAAVEVVRQLGVANLAVATAGIGVSVAGFAILSAKIGRLEAKVEAMTDTLAAIARGVDALRRDRIADDFSRLRTTCEQMDEGWSLSDGQSQWRQVASEAHILVNQFERRAVELLAAPEADHLAAEAFIDAVGLAGATRVAARLATGDDAAARRAAHDTAHKLSDLVGSINVAEVAIARVRAAKAEPGTPTWEAAVTGAVEALNAPIAGLRDRQIAAASTAVTLAELESRSIPGRQWIELARREEESPFICLLPDQS